MNNSSYYYFNYRFSYDKSLIYDVYYGWSKPKSRVCIIYDVYKSYFFSYNLLY